MIRSAHRPCTRPRRPALGVLVALTLACALPAAGQTFRRPPEGIPVGPWFLAPYLMQGVEHDDNLYRVEELDSNDPDFDPDAVEEPRSVTSIRTTLGLIATLPISNGHFELDYKGDDFDYRGDDEDLPDRNREHEGLARLVLNFGSGDRLSISERYTLGNRDTLTFDPGGERVFEGLPFNMNRWEVELSRSVPKRQGYLMRVARIDMNFEEISREEDEPELAFFDYRGFDTRYEYRHPLTGNRTFVLFHGLRRFNYYEPRGNRFWSVGAWRRKEESGSLQVGLRGSLGPEQPYRLRLGWGKFHLFGLERNLNNIDELELSPFDTEYTGLVGEGNLSLRVGGRTDLEMTARRRPLPSGFPTYYIVNEFSVDLNRRWLQYSKAGINGLYAKSRYGDVLGDADNVICGNFIRRDDRWYVEPYLEWWIHRKFGFRVSAAHYQRRSNCDGADYEANVLSVGWTLGWY